MDQKKKEGCRRSSGQQYFVIVRGAWTVTGNPGLHMYGKSVYSLHPLQMCGRQDRASAPGADDNSLATNYPNYTQSVGSVAAKLHHVIHSVTDIHGLLHLRNTRWHFNRI
jgi:hypothetical protein